MKSQTKDRSIPTGAERPPPFMPHWLLVVDDDTAAQFAMQDYFTRQGWLVESTGTQHEAEELLASIHYTAVITDLNLQGASDHAGLAVADYVRAHSPRTRIVLLTAYSSPDIEAAARARGVDVVLPKPQPLAAVAQVLATLLGSAP